jgi:cbb3-type cytochrome oxidase subunit 3
MNVTNALVVAAIWLGVAIGFALCWAWALRDRRREEREVEDSDFARRLCRLLDDEARQ